MTSTDETSTRFTDEERVAMRERSRELKAVKRRGQSADQESEVLAKIAEMTPADRTMAARIHAIVKKSAPDLSPRLWYGMPAYARDGKVICHFQDSRKFKTRYATLGFSDQANLDDGNMWPAYYALMKLTLADEARIATLIKQAAS